MTESIGFIGLGKLGLPVATNLLEAGHTLRVYNRTASKADPLVARGAELAHRPSDVVTSGGVVVTLVWDDAALESIVKSDGFLDRLGDGIHISMSTVSPDAARRIAALHRPNSYVEAPVFGRPEAAVAKQLWIPMSGEAAAKLRAQPLLHDMGAQGVFDFGEAAGAAVTVKIAGNFMIISATRTMAEALAMAEHNGVDPKAMIAMMTSTLFSAPIYKSYGTALANKVPPVHSDIPLKDVGLFIQTAEQHHSPTPISSRLLELLKR
jgi:3-hydroxyisobutyrate dehydrogenase-like beta-hydroxyacid dehydrogenase